MFLQRKALTVEKYMAEQCAMYIKSLSVTHKKKVKLLAASEVKCCKRCQPQPRIKVVILSGGYLGLWGGGDT